MHLASLEGAPQSIPAFHAPTEAVPSHVRPPIGEQTALVDFETAPFPYHGMMGDSGRPFLNAGEESHRGHVSFRGHVFWESETFSDDRVLLHIPPGFDPTLPAVMVVFFHGHGANLARDVRDRQQVPAQISAAGVNAVLVAPQFAVDAADSSAGKFWEPNGFKHFLDEAAVKLARLYGDPRRAAAFAKMPIVIVAYSGGFGPTLSVLDRGGVRSRVHGVVLLDALYAGIDKFADWIADNRSAFFVSSYTPHTARHNVDLEQLLSERFGAFQLGAAEESPAGHGCVPADRRYLTPRFREPCLGRLSDRRYSGENGQLQGRDRQRCAAALNEHAGFLSQLIRFLVQQLHQLAQALAA